MLQQVPEHPKSSFRPDHQNKPTKPNSLMVSTRYSQSLWTGTPCTMPFVSASSSFDKGERFRYRSIYDKDDVNKAKKVFNEYQRPDLLLIQFRKQIQEAGSQKYQKLNKCGKSAQAKKKDEPKPLKLSSSHNSRTISPDKVITDKLYQITPRQDYRYDRYGNRSNLIDQGTARLKMKDDINSVVSSKDPVNITSNTFNGSPRKSISFLTSSRRVDLSRPLNYYPGPNVYNIEGFLSERRKSGSSLQTKRA